jgi:hypothetical protein
VTLTGHDVETCELTFSIVSGPGHGTLGTLGDQTCTPGSPNTDTATVTYTPAPGYTGPDSFTYKANDGTDDSSTATVTIDVAPVVTTLDFFPTSVSIGTGQLAGGSAASMNADDNVYYQVNSTGGSNPTVLWIASITGVPTNPTSIKLTYSALCTSACTQTIWIWRWTTSSWVRLLDAGSLGPTETKLTFHPSGAAADYVSSSGQVQVKLRYGGTSTPYQVDSDLLQVTVTTG